MPVAMNEVALICPFCLVPMHRTHVLYCALCAFTVKLIELLRFPQEQWQDQINLLGTQDGTKKKKK